MADEAFTVTIKGPGVSVEQKVSRELANRAVLLVLSGGTTTAKPTLEAPARQEPPRPEGDEPPPSISEFFAAHAAKRHIEKITAIGQFLKQYAGKATVGRSDLVAQFELASEPPPKNLGRDLDWAVKVGWIAPQSDDPDKYYVTRSGLEAVQKSFPDDLRGKTKITQGARRKKRTAKESKANP